MKCVPYCSVSNDKAARHEGTPHHRQSAEEHRHGQRQVPSEGRQRPRPHKEERQRSRKEDRRRQLHEEEYKKRRLQREEDEQRWQRREEEQRRRRYEEQQRRLEEEQRLLEEEEQQQRKRHRMQSTGCDARPDGEPRTKQQRTSPHLQVKSADQAVAMPAPAASEPSQQPHGAVTAAAAGKAGAWDFHERQQQRRMANYWHGKHLRAPPFFYTTLTVLATDLSFCLRLFAYDTHLAAVKEKSFKGCMEHVAQHVLQDGPPRQADVIAKQLLLYLTAGQVLASFQSAAERLVAAHEQGHAQARMMPTPEASLLISECSKSLQQLADLLARPLPRSSCEDSILLLPAASGPHPALLDVLISGGLLSLMASILDVPRAHREMLEQRQQLAPVQPAIIEAAMTQQLGLGIQALLETLASSRHGVRGLLGEVAVLQDLLLGTEPRCLAAGWQISSADASGAILQCLTVAEVAAAQLCRASLGSEELTQATETAVLLLHSSGVRGRQAMQRALAHHAPAAVPRLLLMLHMHCTLLLAACGHSTGGSPYPDFELLLEVAPACAHASVLLAALTRTTQLDVLGSWRQQADAIQKAAAAELVQLEALPDVLIGSVAGLGATMSALSSLQGSIAALSLMGKQDDPGMLPGMLGYLEAVLPALASPAAGNDGTTALSSSVIEWPPVEGLFW